MWVLDNGALKQIHVEAGLTDGIETAVSSPENHWNALTDGRSKYIFHARDGEEQLFDLRSDPYELADLAGDPGRESELRKWRQRLVEHFASHSLPGKKSAMSEPAKEL